MRTRVWVAVLVVGLGLGGTASAQQTLAFGGFVPITQNVPISTVNAAAPIATPQAFPTKFSLTSFFPKISPFAAKPTLGQSQFPTFSQLPGKDYLGAFQMRRGVGY